MRVLFWLLSLLLIASALAKTIDMRKEKRDISSYQAMMDYIENMIERQELERRKLEDAESADS